MAHRPKLDGQLLQGQVIHRRLSPRLKGFRYRAYYVHLPLAALADGALDRVLPVDRPGIQSFYTRDHGHRDGRSLRDWLNGILSAHTLPRYENVSLVCLPRVLGYVFNPVSFWLCRDDRGDLCAVVCEVNNTFGETHSYLCAHRDGRALGHDDVLWARKALHVSPFLAREGRYRFAFHVTKKSCGIKIDYFDATGKKTLMTSLTGRFVPLTRPALRAAFWRNPFLPFRVVALIHYQAGHLWRRGVRLIKKPPPVKHPATASESPSNATSDLTSDPSSDRSCAAYTRRHSLVRMPTVDVGMVESVDTQDLKS